MTIKKTIIIKNRDDHCCYNSNDDDNDDCRTVFDVLFSVYYVRTLQRKDEFVWNSIIYAYTCRMWQNSKHTYTHDCWFVSVFQEKKTEKQRKNDDVSTTTLLLLLLLFGRASERTERVRQQREKLGRLAAATERKSLRVCDGNRVRRKKTKRKSDSSMY